ncbi:immunoglobulin-like domain-containing protein [Bifidobacterium cebidarum]|uniref:CBM6 domain-containing protein n=1 Tax=Bifidobacterium cebidarum TaxID=2650773 RepID=A0A6I1GAK1_9BIFI|nr:immunoglobulin-like domain-containing protein [Bifidobacterium cebidarum]KAB7786786.1 hypothetical protein F7D08_1663 [Bifidobacterium cebidarum]
MRLRKSLASLLAVATLGAGAVTISATANADDIRSTDITIDLNQSTGPVEYGATGFLYGLADDGVPTDTMLQGLGHLHTQVGRPTDGKQHPNGDSIQTSNQWFRNGGQYIQVYLKDAYELPWPYRKYDPNITEDFLPKIKKEMDTAKAAGLDTSKVVLIPFNEPSNGDANYRQSEKPGTDGFNTLVNDWDLVYRYIQDYNTANSTKFKVGGPNYTAYYPDAYDAFLKHVAEQQTVPDVVTWHELQNKGVEATSFLPHYEHWRSIETKYLGADSNIPVSINEYVSADLKQQTRPGNLVQYISQFENHKVSGALAYWYPAGDLDWLATHNNQATSGWWLYNWYGQLSGNTVKIGLQDENQRTQAVASYDQKTNQTKILFGGAENGATSATDSLKIAGAADKYPNGAHVTVFGVDATAPGDKTLKVPEASKGTYVQWQGNATARQLADGLTLAGLNPDSAYFAVITPGAVDGQTGNQSDGAYEAEYTHVADANNNVSANLTTGYGEGANGAGYVTGFDKASAEAGDANKFFVTSEKDGYANIAVRYQADKDSKLALKVNRGNAITLTLPATNGKWAETTVRTYLPLGINELDFTAPDNAADAAGVKLDDIKLTDDTDTAAQKSEAESGEVSNGVGVFDDSTASGGKAINNVGGSKNGTVAFTVTDVPEDGDYTLTFSYAQWEYTDNTPFQIVNRWADVTVNGDASSTQQVVFANTRNWHNYWTTSIRANLKKGSNTVTVTTASAKQGWAPNFDYLQVGRTAVQTSVPQQSMNAAPQIKGADDVTINEGDAFDAKTGVTASDAEDGDLTDKIQVEGAVDVKKAGSYELTYTVTDSAGAKATVKRTVTVKTKDANQNQGGQIGQPGAGKDDNATAEGKGSGNVLGNTGVAVSAIAIAAIVLAAVGTLITAQRKGGARHSNR